MTNEEKINDWFYHSAGKNHGRIPRGTVLRWLNEKDEEITRLRECDRDMLKAAGYVLKEAVEKLLDSDEQLKTTTDEDLEVAIENGCATDIRLHAEAILLARKALGMTNYIFPPNTEISGGGARSAAKEGSK